MLRGQRSGLLRIFGLMHCIRVCHYGYFPHRLHKHLGILALSDLLQKMWGIRQAISAEERSRTLADW